MYLQSNSYKINLHKAGIYKADSNQMNTFFVQQMKNLSKTTLREVGTGLKSNFNERSTHIFLLKL